MALYHNQGLILGTQLNYQSCMKLQYYSDVIKLEMHKLSRSSAAMNEIEIKRKFKKILAKNVDLQNGIRYIVCFSEKRLILYDIIHSSRF